MATLKDTSFPTRKCVGCGAELAGSGPPGLCPKCLLKLAMETQPGAGPAGTARLPGAEVKSRALPQPGDPLGHYSILRALGAGAMGAVYEAQDLENGRRVALKVLSHTLDSPEARERFFREGRLAASINHPNSVYVFGTEEIGGTPVIAMELVAGGTLQDRVRTGGPLPIGEAVDCVLQIIEGLEAAQRVGILHRDIKPSNCYVGEDGAVKVGDFGLSISTTVRTEPALTATGAFLGTPAFCSPEQLRGEELNTRSDMYAVGATLFYLLTGRTPFEAKSVVALLATVFEQRPPSPRKLRSEIPQGLAAAILRCLEKQSSERFKGYAELARALAPYGSTAPTPATFGLRFLAGALDMTALGVLGIPIFWLIFGSPMQVFNLASQHPSKSAFGSSTGFLNLISQDPWKLVIWGLAGFLSMGLYYGVLEGLRGAAAGKAICGLRVVGLDRNRPGIGRAVLRALVFGLTPALPYWLVCGVNMRAFLSSSQLSQSLLGFGCYGLMALLFCTARRRNGFAAVQDLLTKTRVVAKADIAARPILPASETPPPLAVPAATIGPYHILQSIQESAGASWLLGYDLRLLRKVWIRTVPAGTEPLPIRLGSLGRVGRLRWLTGKRSPAENWDAFEALTGQPLLDLAKTPQRWSEVRYWLYDLAGEISAAEKDATLPQLALNQVWITGDGRAKLLDFPAPGIASGVGEPASTVPSATPPMLGSRCAGPIQPCGEFLAAVGVTALTGGSGPLAESAGDVETPLHARAFLEALPRLVAADEVVAALKPLLHRVAAVSRLRRAAIVAACIIPAVLMCALGLFGMASARQFSQSNPGVMDLSLVLRARSSAGRFQHMKEQWPPDSQVAIYIAHHYRGVITNEALWSSPFVLALIKGPARKFAEQCVADHPAPTPEEFNPADAVLDKSLAPIRQAFAFAQGVSLGQSALSMVTMLGIYVCLPALAAALVFRGGLVLRIAGLTFVRKDGEPVSRPRLLWRGMVAWCPLCLPVLLSFLAILYHLAWAPWLGLGLFGLLAVLSVALPRRGLQDRLAGTWPVLR